MATADPARKHAAKYSATLEQSDAVPLVAGLAADPAAGPAVPWYTTVAVGQCISVLVTATAVSSTVLSTRLDGRTTPGFQSLCAYVLLAAAFGRAAVSTVHRRSWLEFFGIACFDVAANYLVVLAYRYTSIVSVMLLDCFTIVVVMTLSRVARGTRYRRAHCAGAGVCVAGLCTTVLSDYVALSACGTPQHPQAIKGDLLCLLGAALYGVSNVAQETLVRRHGFTTYLGGLSCAACALALGQVAAFELGDIRATPWADTVVLGAFAGYAVALALAYTTTSWLFTWSDACFFNLSLLTSDIYAALFAAFAQGQHFNPFLLVAFGVTAAGIGIYESAPAPSAGEPAVDCRTICRRPSAAPLLGGEDSV